MPGRITPPPTATRLFDPAPIPGGYKESDEYYTPAWMFEALGCKFDLDVAAPPGGLPWIPAARSYSEVDNGLGHPWDGLVWCNPPYSNPAPWVKRMADHRNGIMLLPADTGTSYFHDHVAQADALCFIRGRIAFVASGESQSGWTARFPSLLVGWGDGAEPVRSCGLGWTP